MSGRRTLHHQAGHPYPTKTRTDIVPHSDASPPDLLSHSQLQEEEWDANDEEQDEVWHQVRTYKHKEYGLQYL